MSSLWIDADPSGLYQTGLDCDDDLAILIAIALHQRQIINLTGLSICGGNAPLRHTWNDANILWKYINGYERTGIKHPMKGYGWNSMQVGVKLLQYYNMIFPDVNDSDDAATVLQAADKQHNAKPMTILSLGPPTNIAKAIQQRSSTMNNNNIEHIYLMGGELTNQQLDLNFRSDRASARIVINADVPKTIIPIQTCGQVTITEEWISSLNCNNHQRSENSDKKVLAVCSYISKMKQQVRLMPRFVNRDVKDRMAVEEGREGSLTSSHYWKPSPNLDRGFIPWDIIALLAITHPNEFDQWKYHRISFPNCSSGEPCDGTMTVVEDLPNDYFDNDDNNGVKKEKNWSGIARVPHKVRNETRILEIMLDLISDIEVPSSSPLLHDQQQWGFGINIVSGFSIATAMFVICCVKLWFRPRREGQGLRL